MVIACVGKVLQIPARLVQSSGLESSSSQQTRRRKIRQPPLPANELISLQEFFRNECSCCVCQNCVLLLLILCVSCTVVCNVCCLQKCNVCCLQKGCVLPMFMFINYNCINKLIKSLLINVGIYIVMLSTLRLSVFRLKCVHKNAIFSKTKQFAAVICIGDQQEVLHGLIKEPILGPLG